jgi:hypothetical protein
MSASRTRSAIIFFDPVWAGRNEKRGKKKAFLRCCCWDIAIFVASIERTSEGACAIMTNAVNNGELLAAFRMKATFMKSWKPSSTPSVRR